MSTEDEIQLPLKSVVLFIACGALVCILVFLFVKRQISRFTLKSGKVPYANIGTGAPRQLKNEIERRLNRIPQIRFEPKAFSHKLEEALQTDIANGRCTYLYRMKAVDALAFLDEELSECEPPIKRNVGVGLKEALLDLKMKGVLRTAKYETIEALTTTYDNARYGIEEFGINQYKQFMDLLSEIIFCIKTQPSSVQTTADNEMSFYTTTPDTDKNIEDKIVVGSRISDKSIESINLIDIEDNQVRFLPGRGSAAKGFHRLRSSSSSNSSTNSQEDIHKNAESTC